SKGPFRRSWPAWGRPAYLAEATRPAVANQALSRYPRISPAGSGSPAVATVPPRIRPAARLAKISVRPMGRGSYRGSAFTPTPSTTGVHAAAGGVEGAGEFEARDDQ